MTRMIRHRKLIIAAVAIVGVAVGAVSGSAAFAIWSMRLTATGTVSAGAVSVSVIPIDDAAFTNSVRSVTSRAVVVNSSQQTSMTPAQAALELAAAPAAGVAANAILTVWPVPADSDCADSAVAPSDAVTGDWGAGITMPAITLAPGAQQRYCLRTAFVDRQHMASAAGTQTFAAQVGASLTVGSFAATAPIQAATITITDVFPFGMTGDFWYRVIPTTQSSCIDVTGGVNAASGTALGTWICHTQVTPDFANQWVTMSQVAQDAVVLRLGGPENRAMQANPNGTVTTQLLNPANPAQTWEPQRVSGDTYILVSRDSGLCMTAAPTNSLLSMAPCDSSPLQRFGFQQLAVTPPTPLAAASAVRPASFAVARNPDVVDVSGDGITFTRDYTDLFGASILVPHSTATDTFRVRNTGDSPGFLRLVLTNVRIRDPAVFNALSISAGTPDAPGDTLPFAAAVPCAVLSQGQRIDPDHAVEVTTRLLLGDLTRRDGQGVPVDFSIQVQLGSQPTDSTDCRPERQSEQDGRTPVISALSATGASVPIAGLAIGIPLVTAGSVLLWHRRRRSIQRPGDAR